MTPWNFLSLRFFPVLAALAGFAVVAGQDLAAQLQWDATTIRQELTLGQESAEAEFYFENVGSYPIVIRDTSSSCGCTTAKLTRTTYYPGDKGVISAHFDVGNRTGTRRNTIRVLTDDPTAPSTTLTFSVEIPTLIEFSPRLVHWRVGEEAAAKSVKVQINPESGLDITGVEADRDAFDVELVPGVKEGEFEVRLLPTTTKSPERAIISLQTEPDVENRQNFSFYAYVR